jgi:protein-histidine pros-kinase
MKLALKFNLILISVLIIGFAIAGVSSYTILQKNAEQEILDRAKIMMEAAVAMRGYTVKEVRPLLKVQNKRNFLPQTVPAYAATQTFDRLRKKYPEYTYKEATLNPTNPRNRAIDWEHDVIQRFNNDSALTSLVGKRDTLSGESLYFASPIKITNPACLNCHSTVEAAPTSMIKLYGTANGFGWKINEVVGAQIVTVPMELSIQQAHHAFVMFMSILAVVFIFILIVLNILLRSLVIKPIIEMADVANRMSQGEENLPEFKEKGKNEIAVLGASFNRMKRSLEKAMDMLGS